MTAPLFYVDPADLVDADALDEVIVSGEEGRHAVSVRRLEPGEFVQVSDGNGRIVTGPVLRTEGKDSLVVAVQQVTTVPVPTPTVTVALALIKGERMERAVESLAEIGVDTIVVWQAEHCVVRWDRKDHSKAMQRLVKKAQQASKLARRSHLCRIERLTTLDGLVERINQGAHGVVLHEGEGPALAETDLSGEELFIVIGPEGGLTETEIERLVQSGAVQARMGSTVMRAGTAATAAAAVVMSRTQRWSPSNHLA